MEKNVNLHDYETMESLLDDLKGIESPMLDMHGTMERFIDIKARKLGIPIHGTFELTPLCNLDCRMCYVHLNKDQLKDKKLLTAQQWKGLIDQAVDAGMLDATLTGGECLTYPGFDEIYLHLQSKGIRTTIMTNGLLLTQERMVFFKKYPPRFIQVSLYGGSEDEYEAVTGYRCFERVLDNIRRLAQTKITSALAITPNCFMPNGGETVVRLAHSLGMSYSINTSLFRPREDTGRQNDAIDMDVDKYIRLQVLRRELNGTKVLPIRECELPVPGKAGKPMKGLLCAAGNSSFDICWDGTMRPCSSFEDIAAYPLQDGFAAAWKKVRAESLEYPLPAECPECPYRELCPSCVLIHRQDTPAGHASPKVCDRAKKLVSSGLVTINIENKDTCEGDN